MLSPGRVDMSEPHFSTISIVGVGLLGASLALAAKQQKLCDRVIGVGRNQATLEDAQELGIVDEVTTDLGSGVKSADLVVLCTPVFHIVKVVGQVLNAAKPGAIVTDVGSTKASIVSAAEAASQGTAKFFVGSHPMAGSEKSGMRNARPDLYANSTCIVTKTRQTDLKAFAQVCALWTALGCRVVIARPDRHDHLIGMVSHLPHLLAVALVRTLAKTQEDKNLIKGIIGNGFRDTTRIAAGSPAMWQDICADNSAEIRSAREQFNAAVAEIVELCSRDESVLKNLLEEAADYREFLDLR